MRALLDDPRISDLPAHLTLISPINLNADELIALQVLLRVVAAQTTPFTLGLGPVASFAPATPTLHLSVTGQLAALLALREQLLVPPVYRPDTWPFTPHVTLREYVPLELIGPALMLLSGELSPWTVDCLYLLEHLPQAKPAGWVPILQEPFNLPVVVGRGGIQLRLRTLSLVEPQVEQLLAEYGYDHRSESRGQDRLMLVVAELSDQPGMAVAAAVGVLSGPSAELQQIVVCPEHRRLGIGRQTLMHWCAEAANRNAEVAVAALSEPAQILQRWGFEPVGRSMVRRLLIQSAE